MQDLTLSLYGVTMRVIMAEPDGTLFSPAAEYLIIKIIIILLSNNASGIPGGQKTSNFNPYALLSLGDGTDFAQRSKVYRFQAPYVLC